MQDSAYTIFFIFGCLWIVLVVGAWMALLKIEGQPIRLDRWGLVVVIPILLPLIAAFTIAAIYHPPS